MIRPNAPLLIYGFLTAFLVACGSPEADDLNSGGLEPPPGFLEQVDTNCRAETDLALSDEAPTVRQLNGQSLLTYALTDGGTAQCAVRHADGSVIDIRRLDVE